MFYTNKITTKEINVFARHLSGQLKSATTNDFFYLTVLLFLKYCNIIEGTPGRRSSLIFFFKNRFVVCSNPSYGKAEIIRNQRYDKIWEWMLRFI